MFYTILEKCKTAAKAPCPMPEMQLHDPAGQRLYLTPDEREAFAAAAMCHAPHDEARTFARTLYYTGCRPSEAVELTARRVDAAAGVLTFRTLKKRVKPGEPCQHWRSVPVPSSFLDELALVHRLKSQREDVQLWPITRQTGWNWCKHLMQQIDLDGPHATAKGLRHGFGVACVMRHIPLPTLQKWMGHASLETTAIYLQVTGQEEKDLAARLWR